MKEERYEIQQKTQFSESLFWDMNRDYYLEKGISAWSDGLVPHHITSNSEVGKTYAGLLYAMLRDLANKGNISDKVYILELGAGHGRLAFHVLRHLSTLIESTHEILPPFCYILSDMVADNIAFFGTHPQLQEFYNDGTLDICYFDAISSNELRLQKANKTILPGELKQPLVALANYFFDSIPNDLLHFKDKEVFSCEVAIHSSANPKGMSTVSLIKNMELSYTHSALQSPFYLDESLNSIVQQYQETLADSYVFIPTMAIACIQNLKAISRRGLVVLTMDKGFHELHELEGKPAPDVVRHGSLSLWVNYHTLSAYCTNRGGKAMLPAFSNFHIEVGCLMFLEDIATYKLTHSAYQQYVDDFGPDDFNTLKHLAYTNISTLSVKDLIALFRLSAYDSTFFLKLLPRLKEVYKSIVLEERTRLIQTFDNIWHMYFHINETFDLGYEIGGMLYDLGHYTKALQYFQYSSDFYGSKVDIYYNQALCYYQLREDKLFYSTIVKAKAEFPESPVLESLEGLDMA